MRRKFTIYVLLGTFFLLSDAFYNGFPIVYSDTSTYIASGMELETPFDRPVTYGLFLRLFSLNGLSLWSVVFFQALILSYLIFSLVKLVANQKSFHAAGLITILFLSLFTGISWTVSQIMPDIFTSIGILCITLILLGTYRLNTLIFLYVLFFLSVAMHMSHVLLFVLLLIAILLLRKFLLPVHQYPRSASRIVLLFFLTVCSIVTMGSAASKSKHVFLMGAMVEHGIVKKYLDEHCNTGRYKLCMYKDSLPDRAYKFIWDEESPFYKIGGWKETKNEFNAIIYETLTHPGYVALHIKESFKATLQQLTLFAIGDGNGSFPEGTLLYERISTYFPRDLHAYASSRQNQSRLDFPDTWNVLFSVVIVLSVFLLLYLLAKIPGSIYGPVRAVTAIFLLGVLFNAFGSATFANAIDRLGCKVIWLIPFAVIILSWKIRNEKGRKDAIPDPTA